MAVKHTHACMASRLAESHRYSVLTLTLSHVPNACLRAASSLAKAERLHVRLRPREVPVAATGRDAAPPDLGRDPPLPFPRSCRLSSLLPACSALAPAAVTQLRVCSCAAGLPAWIRSRQEAKVPLESRLVSGFLSMSSTPYRRGHAASHRSREISSLPCMQHTVQRFTMSVPHTLLCDHAGCDANGAS